MVSRIGSGRGTGSLDLGLRCEPESGHSTVEKIVNVLYCDTMFTPKQIHERQPLKTAAFRKTLVAFDFDEKLIQNNYVTSCICLYFAVDLVLSFSEYDLENRRMPYQQKYWIKSMAVKIPVLVLLRFSWLFPVSILPASFVNYLSPFRWF